MMSATVYDAGARRLRRSSLTSQTAWRIGAAAGLAVPALSRTLGTPGVSATSSVYS